jgi:hypothetical protein
MTYLYDPCCLQDALVHCQTLIFGCGTLRAPAMGVVFCLSFHTLRTSERATRPSERATRRRRLTPILSFDKCTSRDECCRVVRFHAIYCVVRGSHSNPCLYCLEYGHGSGGMVSVILSRGKNSCAHNLYTPNSVLALAVVCAANCSSETPRASAIQMAV